MNAEDVGNVHKELRESSNERPVPQPVLTRGRASFVQAADPSKTPITSPIEAYQAQQSVPVAVNHVEPPAARHSVVPQRQAPRATVASDNLTMPVLKFERRESDQQFNQGNGGFQTERQP